MVRGWRSNGALAYTCKYFALSFGLFSGCKLEVRWQAQRCGCAKIVSARSLQPSNAPLQTSQVMHDSPGFLSGAHGLVLEKEITYRTVSPALYKNLRIYEVYNIRFQAFRGHRILGMLVHARQFSDLKLRIPGSHIAV